MTAIIVFPGQGSQRKGMGSDLFERFPQETALADEILGYSIRHLCLEDPDRRLRDTRFTQPALFVVNALSYLAWREQNQEPMATAGHSLGEYNALVAAGVLDYGDALRLVHQRGNLMAQARSGGMAAVVGPSPQELRLLLDGAGLEVVDIANFNTPDQITIAGLSSDLERAESVCKQAGARYVTLNVSAAFHSRYMAEAAESFARNLAEVSFAPARFPVIANLTAQPYPASGEESRQILAAQICGSVRWYETVSLLLSAPNAEIQEIGPGNVLTKMVKAIAEKPMPVAKAFQPTAPAGAPSPGSDICPGEGPIRADAHLPSEPLCAAPTRKLTYMYTGLGSQYASMGAELYREHRLFRATMDECADLAAPFLGQSFTEMLYRAAQAPSSFEQLDLSLVTNLALGVALTRVLEAEGHQPDLMLGYGSGELTAAVCAGSIPLQQGLRAAVYLGQLIERSCAPGQMLAVFTAVAELQQRQDLITGCEVIGTNAPLHHILAAETRIISETVARLKEQRISCQLLPCQRALHHHLLDPAESGIAEIARSLSFCSPRYSLYSPALGAQISPAASWLWQSLRTPVRFGQAISRLDHPESLYVELGPSGTLAGFVGYQIGAKQRALSLINRFGRNLDSLRAASQALQGMTQAVGQLV